MRKALWTSGALVLLLSGAALWWGPGAQAATTTVTMGSDAEPNAFKFFPAEITVPLGSTVRWQNKSDIPHDATANNGSFKSDQLTKNQTYEFTFSTPGEFPYICTVSGHKDAGMEGVVKVVGSGTPTPAPTTPTTQPAAGATTTTTAAQAGASTSTTARSGAASTTTTAAGNGATTTTLAPSVTPTSGPDTAPETTTTTAAAEGGGEAAADHGSEGGSEHKEKKKNSPIGIAFASVSTLLLAAIAGKLLASKS